MFESGIPKMDLVVNDAGKEVQPCGIHPFVGCDGVRRVDRPDDAVLKKNARRANAVGKDAVRAGDQSSAPVRLSHDFWCAPFEILFGIVEIIVQVFSIIP
jgi:hypothetical protein